MPSWFSAPHKNGKYEYEQYITPHRSTWPARSAMARIASWRKISVDLGVADTLGDWPFTPTPESWRCCSDASPLHPLLQRIQCNAYCNCPCTSCPWSSLLASCCHPECWEQVTGLGVMDCPAELQTQWAQTSMRGVNAQPSTQEGVA